MLNMDESNAKRFPNDYHDWMILNHKNIFFPFSREKFFVKKNKRLNRKCLSFLIRAVSWPFPRILTYVSNIFNPKFLDTTTMLFVSTKQMLLELKVSGSLLSSVIILPLYFWVFYLSRLLFVKLLLLLPFLSNYFTLLPVCKMENHTN